MLYFYNKNKIMTFLYEKYKEITNLCNKNLSKNLEIQQKIIVVSKNQTSLSINEAIKHGVTNFAENRLQEALLKFKKQKKTHRDLELHMTGPLQTNKVKKSLEIFDYFHTLDRKKLANEFYKHINSSKFFINKKFFIQVNTGEEPQKSGVFIKDVKNFVNYCAVDLKLNIIGLMCIPPIKENPKKHFQLIANLAEDNGLKFLSMGMSADYKIALECGATHIRLGTILFKKS